MRIGLLKQESLLRMDDQKSGVFLENYDCSYIWADMQLKQIWEGNPVESFTDKDYLAPVCLYASMYLTVFPRIPTGPQAWSRVLEEVMTGQCQ